MRYALATLLIFSACGDNGGTVDPPTSYDLGEGDGFSIETPDLGVNLADGTADLFLLVDAPKAPDDGGMVPPDGPKPPLDMPTVIVDTAPPILDAAPTSDGSFDGIIKWPFDFKLTFPDGLFKVDQGTPTVDSGLPNLSDFGIINPKFCTSDSSCKTSEYCSKSSCTSLVLGTCVTKPKDCSTDTAADYQCGCDGITYYNSCYRKLAGQNAESTTAECDSTNGNTKKCGGASFPQLACPSGTHKCVKVAASETNCTITGALGTGKCWALPNTCPSAIILVRNYRSCSDAATCLSMCDAMKSGTYYAKQCIKLP